jgi:hypothetical protein
VAEYRHAWWNTALNIKDDRTLALARRLAVVTAQYLTEAVRIAIGERLARVERQMPRIDHDLVARLDPSTSGYR